MRTTTSSTTGGTGRRRTLLTLLLGRRPRGEAGAAMITVIGTASTAPGRPQSAYHEASDTSTIIGLKLLPTTALHHRHMGQVMVSILLLQDILAIVILVFLEAFSQSAIEWQRIAILALAIPALITVAFLFERYVLQPLIQRFDTIQEYVFLTAIGWCLGMAQLAETAGLSYETGAFIAGVALATNPISLFIAESFKPLNPLKGLCLSPEN